MRRVHWFSGICRSGVELWGCFTGQARKTPPQPPFVTAIPKRPVYFVTGLVGVLLVAWVLQEMDWPAVWAAFSALTPISLVVLLAVNAVITLLFSARWWLILRSQGYDIPYLSLAVYRLAGFGVSYFTPGTQFGGEPLQVYLLYQRRSVPAAVSLASVTFDKLLELLASLAFLVLGVAVIVLGGLSDGFSLILVLSVVGLLCAPLAAYTAALWLGHAPLGWLLQQVFQSGRLRSRCFAIHSAVGFVGQRLPHLKFDWHPIIQLITAAEGQISALCRRQPRLVLQASGFSAILWALMMIEFWLCLQFFGAPATALQAISLLTVARLAFLSPLPGALGVFEAGQVMAFQALGFPAAMAIALSLLIRARDVSLGLFGLALGARLVAMEKPNRSMIGFQPSRTDAEIETPHPPNY